MSELANYSIETDHTVLLLFKDGRKLRVPMAQLPRHLTPRDLAKIRSAIKLRQDFIRQHMPKASVILIVAAGLLAIMLAGSRAVATLLHRPSSLPPSGPSDNTGIVRSVEAPSPSASPSVQPAPANVAPSRPATTATRHRIARRVTHPTAKKPLTGLSDAATVTGGVLGMPQPAPSPDPSVTPIASPTPTPTPTDAPIAGQTGTPGASNQQGQVLGDSTGPDQSPSSN